MGRKKKYQGHYCWACGRIRPNEQFSGAGHSRHVCRDCQKLGPKELAYRQGVRDIERCLNFGGGIRRKHGKTFDRFLEHSNPRIREYAQRTKAELDARREEWRNAIALDEAMADGSWLNEPDSSAYEGEPDECEDLIPF